MANNITLQSLKGAESTERMQELLKSYADDVRDNDLDQRNLLVDLLADLLHWCDAHGIDLRDALVSAENHFSAEQ